VLQLLQSDTNPCSNRKHVRALTCFRGPSLCLNQIPYPRASKACQTCLSTAEGRSPDALATPRPIGLPQKNQKGVSSCRIAVTTLGDGSLVGQGKRRMHARGSPFVGHSVTCAGEARRTAPQRAGRTAYSFCDRTVKEMGGPRFRTAPALL
jgi:hypothetical protein